MADDLIIKFFREDLTEAEETALLERLSSSVEDALRFGQHAEASYRHYGLPDPQWQGGPPPAGFGPKSGFKPGLWLTLALLTGLSVWGAWEYWKGTGKSLSTSLPAPSTALSPLLKTKKGNLRDSLKKAILPERLPQGQGERVESPDVSTAQPPTSLANAPPALTPPNAAAPSHRSHTNLEVVVKQAKPGPVLVRVLGPDGATAAMLYQGMLQPGSWAFDWNGRMADGRAPPMGSYQIQILSGAVTLSKSVNIHK